MYQSSVDVIGESAERHNLTPANIKTLLYVSSSFLDCIVAEIFQHIMRNPPEVARILGMAGGEVDQLDRRVTRSKALPEKVRLKFHTDTMKAT